MKKENKEHNLFMHSQVPEVEPEDTETIHPDYKGIPMYFNLKRDELQQSKIQEQTETGRTEA